jgi:hypothetical protein
VIKTITTATGVQRILGEKALCPRCGKSCHRKGVTTFKHIGQPTTRWYCGTTEGCGAYHNRIPATGELIEPPADWKEERAKETAQKRLSRAKCKRTARAKVQSIEGHLIALFGIDPASLAFQSQNEKGVGRVIVYETAPDLIAKLDDASQQNVKALQVKVLMINAILGEYKKIVKGLK